MIKIFEITALVLLVVVEILTVKKIFSWVVAVRRGQAEILAELITSTDQLKGISERLDLYRTALADFGVDLGAHEISLGKLGNQLEKFLNSPKRDLLIKRISKKGGRGEKNA